MIDILILNFCIEYYKNKNDSMYLVYIYCITLSCIIRNQSIPNDDKI